ncbi:hypothetical protein TVAG_158630 [Trichomonas vaginalis G3]|uniref:Uncharacterized protein n=2 Tax=Trichomonas vaginalis (strain ATCC PRA-98 / G3) TaxID=412133 RepID=A2E6P2_TRIV3|nr:hypothetical protein TVAG_158630 [Trichomonas vaginalis G3]|eukprot:XP_001323859.1 hypothetical protein [Trichomonas vaginalis G3]
MPHAFRFRTVKRERNEGGFTLFSGVNTLVIPEVVYDLQDNVTYNPYVMSVCLEGVPMLNLQFPIRTDLTVYVTDKFTYGSYYDYPHFEHEMCQDTHDSRLDSRRYDRLDGVYDSNCSDSINDTYKTDVTYEDISDPLFGGNFPYINQKQSKAVFEYIGVSPIYAFLFIYLTVATLALIFSALYITRNL